MHVSNDARIVPDLVIHMVRMRQSNHLNQYIVNHCLFARAASLAVYVCVATTGVASTPVEVFANLFCVCVSKTVLELCIVQTILCNHHSGVFGLRVRGNP